jgi:hypothetical protein
MARPGFFPGETLAVIDYATGKLQEKRTVSVEPPSSFLYLMAAPDLEAANRKSWPSIAA